MTPPDTDPRIQPLLEWNRLARQNAENAIVSSMFEASFQASEPIDAFSTWLLAGAAATAAFFIANAEKLVPFIGRQGFLVCGVLLCLSCLFGMVSRVLALKCRVQIQTSAAVRRTFAEHLAKHIEEEKKIEESAAAWGITLETGVRLERILAEFFAPLPKWAGWLAQRQLRKHTGNPQVGYLPVIKGMQWQGVFTALQAMWFFVFLIAGFTYAAAQPSPSTDRIATDKPVSAAHVER
jgi:hypothetical protein